MMSKLSVSGMALLVLMVPMVGADEKDAENPLEAYQKAGEVGPMHKKLEVMVGEWTYAGKFWMMPGAEGMELTGEAKRTLILGGRFVRDEVTSNSFGPFTGISVTGYDNVRKHFVSSWMDSMSTGITLTTGKLDKTGKTWTFTGQNVDPVTKKKIKIRDLIKIVDKDTEVMESYATAPGEKERKVMELTFKRKK